MLPTPEGQRGEITLDKELGGKQLTKEVIEGLREEQKTLLGTIGDKNDEIRKACEEAEEARDVLTFPEPDLSHDIERTVAAVVVDVAPMKWVKINNEMQNLLRQAVNDGLGTLALVQRMCQRYGLSDFIRGKLSNSGTHTTRV